MLANEASLTKKKTLADKNILSRYTNIKTNVGSQNRRTQTNEWQVLLYQFIYKFNIVNTLYIRVSITS